MANGAWRIGTRGHSPIPFRAIGYFATHHSGVLLVLGNCPLCCPLLVWERLWLTGRPTLGSLEARPSRGLNAPTSKNSCAAGIRETPRTRAMNAQQLLQEISDYCRRTGLAESTFGRRAVNDGKLAARLRNGGRITTDTLDRIHGFMQ